MCLHIEGHCQCEDNLNSGSPTTTQFRPNTISDQIYFVSGELERLKMADIYFYQGDTDEDDGGYCDSNITATNQVSL